MPQRLIHFEESNIKKATARQQSEPPYVRGDGGGGGEQNAAYRPRSPDHDRRDGEDQRRTDGRTDGRERIFSTPRQLTKTNSQPALTSRSPTPQPPRTSSGPRGTFKSGGGGATRSTAASGKTAFCGERISYTGARTTLRRGDFDVYRGIVIYLPNCFELYLRCV